MSTGIAHEPIIDTGTYQQAQEVLDARGRTRRHRETSRRRHPYVFRGRLHCGICQRKMQGQRNHGESYYRCRYPEEYARADHVQDPSNVYLRERDLTVLVDEWAARICAPHRLEEALHAMWNAQGDPAQDARGAETQKKIDECDRRLARYREALEAGPDPKTVAGWISDVQASKAEALSALASVQDRRPLSVTEIRDLVASVGGLAGALAQATVEEKGELYQALGLRLIYQPTSTTVRAQA